MDKYTVIVISLRISYVGAYMASCEQGWFGANCEFACHCKYGPCSAIGQCIESGDLCEEGWFGYMCQYKDAMHGAKVNTSVSDVSLLLDNSPNTCTELTFVRITLAEPLTFTFLRLVLNNEVGNTSFSIQFVLNNSQKATCADVKNFSHEANVDLACKKSSVKEVLVDWPDQLAVCSIYVSGGRNLALRQNVTISSEGQSDFSEGLGSSRFAVDGVKAKAGDFPVNCTSTSKLAIVLGVPQSISSVVITSHVAHSEGMKALQMNLYGEHFDLLVYTYDRHVRVSLGHTVFTFHVNASALIRKIEISLPRNSPPQDVLFVCEIEAFGDCGYPNYGLQCEDICSFRCTDLDCHVTGECWKCDEGYHGVYCEKGTKEVADQPMDDDSSPGPVQTVQSENVSRLLTFIFVVFGATILMEIAGMVHLRCKQSAIVEKVRKSLMDTATGVYALPSYPVPYIYTDSTLLKPVLSDEDRANTSYPSSEHENIAIHDSSV